MVCSLPVGAAATQVLVLARVRKLGGRLHHLPLPTIHRNLRLCDPAQRVGGFQNDSQLVPAVAPESPPISGGRVVDEERMLPVRR